MYLLRVLFNAMGNSASHSALYFKFPSELSVYMDVITEVATHHIAPAYDHFFLFVVKAGLSTDAVDLPLSSSIRGHHNTFQASAQAFVLSNSVSVAYIAHIHTGVEGCDVLSKSVPSSMIDPFLKRFGLQPQFEMLCGAYFNMMCTNAFNLATAPGSQV